MGFTELQSEQRKALYDQWLTNIRNIASVSFRTNIGAVGSHIQNGDYGTLNGNITHDFYGCDSPKELLNTLAALSQSQLFIQRDSHRNYSTPLRRYLEWVYTYISEHNETELCNEYIQEIESHEPLFQQGYWKLDNPIYIPPHQQNVNEEDDKTNEGEISHPHNRIIYGAPGTGKSYRLKQQTSQFPAHQVERVTFHPEYTYFDFVGSYKPVMVDEAGREVIAYRFEAGPFAKILKKALSSQQQGKEDQYVLVIEEINRARAAAVFGDLFQLLDRNSAGQSEYGITPSRDLVSYLTRDNEDGKGVNLEGGKLYLPSNLYLWSTMNSADQGVFPLDTAFKRRWSFEYIPINNSEDKIVGNYSTQWNDLRKHVNNLLQKAGINEDKQMGAFFLKREELENQELFLNAVKEKVIMYLYEDAARHQREQIFKNEKARFSALCNSFDGTIPSIFKEVEAEVNA